MIKYNAIGNLINFEFLKTTKITVCMSQNKRIKCENSITN